MYNNRYRLACARKNVKTTFLRNDKYDMDFHMLAVFLVLIYIIIIVAVFIVFIRILQLLEGELYNQRCIDEQGGDRSPNRPNS